MKVNHETIKKSMQGDDSAFESVYKAYYKHVYFIAYEFFMDSSMAEDITQDVFLNVYKNLSSLSAPEAFHTWICKITYRCCLQKARKKKIKAQTDTAEKTIEDYSDPQESGDPAKIVSDRVFYEAFIKAVNDLSSPLKTVCILRYYENLSIKEISEVTGLPVGTIKSRLNRSRTCLCSALENSGYLPGKREVFNALLPSIAFALDEISQPIAPVNAGSFVNILPATAKHRLLGKLAVIGVSAAVVTGSGFMIYQSIPVEEPVSQAQITAIQYDQTYTNKNLSIAVNSDEPYDYFTIDHEQVHTIAENGTYEISIYKHKKLLDKRVIEINNIDKTAPKQTRVEKNENMYRIYYEDDLSGIDEASVHVFVNGSERNDIRFDTYTNSIELYTSSNEIYQIELSDNAGNTAETLSSEK